MPCPRKTPCRLCKERLSALDAEKLERIVEAAKDFKLWETKIGSPDDTAGWMPPEPWKFKGGTR